MIPQSKNVSDIWPAPIAPGDTIAITAPGFGCTTEPYASRMKAAVVKLESLGYRVVTGDTVFMNDGLGISTNPQVCAAELTRFWLDDSVKAIISAGGGELMCETAGFLDFPKLAAAKQKWFLGYSDNSNFIYPLTVAGGSGGLYTQCISGYGKPWELPEEQVWNVITGKTRSVHGFDMFQSPAAEKAAEALYGPLAPYNYDCPKKLLYAGSAGQGRSVTAEGVYLGGCLDVLANLAGTAMDRTRDYLEKAGPVIWFLESCDANPMELRRQIWHLDQCGWFRSASAVVCGRPLAAWGESAMGMDQYNAVTGILSKYDIPIIMDADFGHIDPSFPIPIGIKGRFTAEENTITLFW